MDLEVCLCVCVCVGGVRWNMCLIIKSHSLISKVNLNVQKRYLFILILV